MYPVEIRDEPRVRAAALPHTGAYPKIGETFGALVERLQAAGVWDGSGPSIALYYDDPSEVPTEALRAHAGQVLPDGVAVPEGLDPIDLGGGRHAVLTYTGAYDGLPEAWAYFYSQWMPASGHSFGAAVPFERYLTNAWETPPAQNVTEICVPLAD